MNWFGRSRRPPSQRDLAYLMWVLPRSVADRTFPHPLGVIGRRLLPAILSRDRNCRSQPTLVPGRLRFEQIAITDQMFDAAVSDQRFR
jgi:hypothetical protein